MGGMKGFTRDIRGQAAVEYILMLVAALAIVSVIGFTFRRSLFKMWSGMTGEISAACPTCPKDPKVKRLR